MPHYGLDQSHKLCQIMSSQLYWPRAHPVVWNICLCPPPQLMVCHLCFLFICRSSWCTLLSLYFKIIKVYKKLREECKAFLCILFTHSTAIHVLLYLPYFSLSLLPLSFWMYVHVCDFFLWIISDTTTHHSSILLYFLKTKIVSYIAKYKDQNQKNHIDMLLHTSFKLCSLSSFLPSPGCNPRSHVAVVISL